MNQKRNRIIQTSMKPPFRIAPPVLLAAAACLCLASGCSRAPKQQPPPAPPAAKGTAVPAVNPAAATGAANARVSAPAAAPAEEGVRLLMGSEILGPSATFELRFDNPVVGPAAIGELSAESPLRFDPPIKGTWTWLSSRSGIFVPDEGLRIDTRYRLTLAPLKSPDGRPIAARLDRTIATPGLGILDAPPKPDDTAGAKPEFDIHFNADVDPATAAPFVKFVDASGRTAAAVTERLLSPFSIETYFRYNQEKAPWHMQFPGSAPLAAGPDSDRSPGGRTPIPSAIHVRPSEPLAPGKGWQLILAKGLPAANPALTLHADAALPIGDVQALAFESAKAQSVLNEGRSIFLKSNKSLGYDDSASLASAVSIEPKPEELQIDREYDGIRLRGAFQLDTSYRVRVAAGLPAPDGTTLAADFSAEVRFAPLPPRLYFPEVVSQQQARGTRRFDFLALNLPRVQVRALLVPPQAAAEIFSHFKERYLKPGDERAENDLEFFKRVDLDAPPFAALRKSGTFKTVWEHAFEIPNAIDEPARVALDWNVILGKDRPGVVILELEAEASGRRIGAQTLVQVTDLGAVLKRAGGEWRAWVFSNRTGRPLAGARLDGPGAGASTAADGTASLETPDSQSPLRLSKESDTLAIQPWTSAGELPPYSFDIPVDYGAAERTQAPARILLFSDRLVYQPGETLHLKGIARAMAPGGLALPAAKTARIRLADPRDRTFFEREVDLSPAGSFDVSAPVPDDILGHCHANVELGSDSEWLYFNVSRFEPDAFEAEIRGVRDFGTAEPAALTLACRYYFGKPLSGAKVRWTVSGSDEPLQPDGFQDFSFLDTNCHYQLRPEPQASREEGELTLAPDGSVALAPAAPLNPTHPAPRSFHALAEITDINQQTVSASASFTRHSSEFYLGLNNTRDGIRVGEPIPVEVIAINTDGTPRNKPVRFTARLRSVEFRTRNIQGAGGSRMYQTEATLVPVAETAASSGRVRRAAGKWQWVPGSGSDTAFQAPAAGTYLLEVEATDAAGCRVRTARSFAVFGRGETDWAYRDPARIELEPDREQYKPGDTATILVKSPIEGTALVTVEREKVLRSFVAEIRRSESAVRIPLVAGDAPNVFVSVVLIRGSEKSPREAPAPEHRFGYCQVNVADPRTTLAIDVRSASESYLPGADVSVEAAVTGNDARPVEGAEVTLYAVDEGVLALTGYETPDPHEFFYAPRGLGVESWLTLLTLLPEDPAKRDYTNKGYIIGDGGGFEESLRRNMLACAFWNATLRSDAKGLVQARFKAPDSITRYRIMAVAAADTGRFGAGQSAFRIQKPLMLHTSQPLFGRVGDRLTVRALAHNQSGRDGSFDVSLECDDKAAPASAGSPLRRVLDIPAGASAAADFEITLTSVGTSRWIWRAASRPDPRQAAPAAARPSTSTKGPRADTTAAPPHPEPCSDAVETTLAITHPVEPLRQICAICAPGGTTELLALADPRGLEGRGSLRFTVANSPLAELADAASYLLHYPYGCVEQTASGLLPLLVLRDSAEAIPGLKERAADIERMARAGLARLLDMQTSAGGLSYWPGSDHANFWSSAYGATVLALARRFGQEVPEGSLSQLHEYLRQQLANTADIRADASLGPRCLAVWALALGGAPEPGYHEILYAKRADLSPENRALLALAVAEAAGPAGMIRELAQSAATGERTASLWFDDPARDAALRLLACTKVADMLPEAQKLADALLALQRDGGWGTTQGNAWAVLALAEHARAAALNPDPASGTIERAGKPVLEFHLPASGGFTESEIALPWAGPLVLRLHNPTQTRLFARVLVESRPEKPESLRQDRGFSIERSYHKLMDDGSSAPAENLAVGDRILVSLRVRASRAAAYVAIEDPLPAILEAVNPAFQSRETAGNTGSDLWFDHTEMRGDKMMWFRDRLPAGQWRFSYLARVRNAGGAAAPPARIAEMYRPERLGTSDPARLSAGAAP